MATKRSILRIETMQAPNKKAILKSRGLMNTLIHIYILVHIKELMFTVGSRIIFTWSPK